MHEQAVAKKDPASTLDWMFDFSKWLKNGDTILDASVETEDEGITLSNLIKNPTNVIIMVGGGTLLQDVRIRCTITTTQGRTTIRTLKMIIEEM